MLNRIILIGRLTADPELRYTPGGTAVCMFTLAVDRNRSDQNGEKLTDFINIVVWQKLGELCAQYLKKGRLAAVDGRLQTRSYENKEGVKIRVTEVVAENVRFLERAEGGNNNVQGEQGGADNHRPFDAGSNGGGVHTGHAGASNGSRSGGASHGGAGSAGGRNHDPFLDDGKPITISDEDLPF